MCRSSISSSDRALAFRYALRTVRALLPILLVIAAMEFAMYRIGENWSWDRIVRAHATHANLVFSRTFFAQQFEHLKPALIRHQRPSIIVVGSSRASKFRDIAFHPFEADFYCASNLAYELNDLIAFISQMREGRLPRPQVLAIVPDPWMFRATSRDYESPLAASSRDALRDPIAHLAAYQSFLWYARHGYYRPTSLLTGSPGVGTIAGEAVVGVMAWAENSGFRRDGTRISPQETRDHVQDPNAIHERKLAELLPVGRGGHATGLFAIDAEMTDALIAETQALSEMGVEVCVVLPPFSNMLHDTLVARGLPPWWDQYFTGLASRFRQAGYATVAVPTPADYGLSEDYMLDTVHPSDVFVSLLVRDLIEQTDAGSLLRRVDVSYCDSLRNLPWSLPTLLDAPVALRAATQTGRE